MSGTARPLAPWEGLRADLYVRLLAVTDPWFSRSPTARRCPRCGREFASRADLSEHLAGSSCRQAGAGAAASAGRQQLPSQVEEAVRRLVVIALAGDKRALEAVRMYYVDGVSVSDIARALGVDRSRRLGLRSRVQRVRGLLRAGEFGRLVGALYPYLVRLPTVYSGNVCPICGRKMTKVGVFHHIRGKHGDLVESVTAQLLEVLRSSGGL